MILCIRKSLRHPAMTLILLLSSKSPKKAKKKTGEAGSNVFSMFEQAQIQEFKEVGQDLGICCLVVVVVVLLLLLLLKCYCVPFYKHDV